MKRYPPPFFLRKCHLVENMTQGSNLSYGTIIRSEFGDWLSISLLSSNLCICVVMSVRMNSVSKCLWLLRGISRKVSFQMIWMPACETDFKIHQILIFFKKKVPKTDYFWHIWHFPQHIFYATEHFKFSESYRALCFRKSERSLMLKQKPLWLFGIFYLIRFPSTQEVPGSSPPPTHQSMQK